MEGIKKVILSWKQIVYLLEGCEVVFFKIMCEDSKNIWQIPFKNINNKIFQKLCSEYLCPFFEFYSGMKCSRPIITVGLINDQLKMVLRILGFCQRFEAFCSVYHEVSEK